MNEPWLTSLFWLWYPQSPAQYHPGPASCAVLTGATPLLNEPFDNTTNGQGWWAALHHIRLNPSYYKKHFEKQTFVWPKSKPWSLGFIHLSDQAFTLFLLPFIFRALTLPRSFGRDIKRDLRGSDSLPFPTRWIHTVTTASGIMITAAGIGEGAKRVVRKSALTEQSVEENNHRIQRHWL